MFTMQNTESAYTENELYLLNDALALLVAAGIDESNTVDIINNNWTGKGDTVESLTARTPK